MRIFTLSLLSIAFLTTSLFANNPSSTPINTERSTVEWVGKKVTGQHSGDISIQSGNIEIVDGELKGGSFVIDMTTINTTDMKGDGAAKLNGHLKSDDFFGVATHPTATLEITSVQAAEAGVYNVTADLTIKGITKPVTFTANVSENMAKANIVVDRTQYDIKYGSGSFFDGLGDKMIDNDFELTVNLVY